MTTKSKLFEEFPPVNTEQWEEIILRDLKGAEYEKKLHWKTLDGLNLKPYYRKENLKNLEYLDSKPNEFPFLRGNKEFNNWEIHQDIESDDPSEANRLALIAIQGGTNSIGLNASKINNVFDIEKMLKDIDLKKTNITFNKAGCYRYLRSVLGEYIIQSSFNFQDFSGVFNQDMFSYFMQNGDFPEREESTLKRHFELVKRVSETFTNAKAINIRGDIYHNSGATPVQELAYTLSSANEYLVRLIDLGLTIDQILPHLQFTFSVGSNYFIEIAKLRAARMLWSTIAKQYDPSDLNQTKVKIHCNTSYYNKSIYDPYTNMLRLTTEAMSAIIGGTDSLQVLPFDISFQKPDEFSTRISRNIQHLLREESYFDKVLDVGAGSYYIENLTHEIAEKAWDLFKEIENNGGFLESAKTGILQDEVEKSHIEREKLIKQRKENTLGTTIFPNTEETILDHISINENKLNPRHTGPYKTISLKRKSIVFETLRLKTEKYVKEGNDLPKVFMIPIGNAAMASARQIFSRNFFGCSGFEIIENSRFLDIETACNTALDCNSKIVVICSSDDDYATIGLELIKKIKASDNDVKIVVAGNPVDNIEVLKQAGADVFIHIKSNILETLEHFQNILGIVE